MIVDASNYAESKDRLRELELLIENGVDELEDYIEANGLSYAIRQYEDHDDRFPYE